MGSIAIFGSSYDDVTAAWTGGVSTPIAGTYYAVDSMGNEPCFSPVMRDRREIRFPGLDWTAEKDYGKTKAILYIDLIVFASLTNLRANVLALHAAVTVNTRATITINGTNFLGCKCDIPATGRGVRCWSGGGIVGERIPYVFKQLSDTN